MTISRWLACAAVAAAVIFANNVAAESAPKTLIIGTEGSYPPFNSLTADGSLVGFDIDIAKALCARMKVECKFVTQDWDGFIPALQAGKFDAIIASMTITEERRKQVAFTQKYYETPLSLVAPKESDLAATDPASVAGMTVGVQAATRQAVYAEDFYARAGARLKQYPSQEEAMQDLLNGRLDVVLADRFMLQSWLKDDSGGCCKMIGDVEGTAAQAGIAVRLEDHELLDRFNAALDAIIADGTYKAIRSKYFDFDIY